MYMGVAQVISNRADWFQQVICNVSGSDEPMDMTHAEVRLELRPQNCCHAVLTGTTDDHIVVGLGFIQWHFTAQEMSGLCAGTYDIAIVVTRFDFASQFLKGTQPVVDGGVSK